MQERTESVVLFHSALAQPVLVPRVKSQWLLVLQQVVLVVQLV
jgi:hypothetical protein